MSVWEIDVVEYGIDDNDHVYGVFKDRKELADVFGSRKEALEYVKSHALDGDKVIY